MKLIPRSRLNVELWDAAIARAVNGMPYAYSWYLDTVSPNWHALLDDSLQWVMPIPVRPFVVGFRQMLKEKKNILQYLSKGLASFRPCVVQPLLCQQLGVFAERHPANIPWEEIFSTLQKRFPTVCAYQLNEHNSPPSFPENFTALPLTNFVLPLTQAYTTICRGYSTGHRRALKKAQSLKWEQKTEDVSLFLENHWRNIGQSIGLGKKIYTLWGKIIRETQKRGLGYFISVRTPDGLPAAMAFILQSNGRLIYQGGYTHAKARAFNPMHALLDGLIQRHAGTNRVLDFEGSQLPSVAEFFRRFGAEKRTYFLLKRI